MLESTLPSAFKNCADVPPLLTKLSPKNLDDVISPDALMSPVTSNSATKPDVLLIPNPVIFVKYASDVAPSDSISNLV